MRLIVLAAGRGARLGPLGADRPKALVPLAGRPLLEWTLEAARSAGIDEVVVVGGYRIDRIVGYPVTVVENAHYATTNMVESLALAGDLFGDGFIVSYGDIAYRPGVLDAVIGSTAPVAVAVDLDWRAYWEARFGDPLRDAESLRLGPDGSIRSIGQAVTRLDEIEGQYMGLIAFRGSGVDAFRATWRRAIADADAGHPVLGRRPSLRELYLTDVLDEIARTGLVHAVPVHGGWVEIDSAHDLAVAERRWAEIDSARANGSDDRAGAPRPATGPELRAW